MNIRAIVTLSKSFCSVKYVGCTRMAKHLICGLIQINLVRFKVLKPITMKGTIFWDVTPCRLVDVYGFSEVHNSHNQCRGIGSSSRQTKASSKDSTLFALLAGLILGL
jgi:hypothetical protein